MRITRLFVLLALAALLAPRAVASRTSVWESNPPAAVLTTTNAAGLLAPLAPAAAADIEAEEPPRFDLGVVVLAESELEHEKRFYLGPLDLLGPTPLRGPPPSYPETRVRGFELLPPFRVGASPSLNLWSRQACGFSCGEVASDSRYDPWGLCGKRGEPPCNFGSGEQTGGQWLAENVLAPTAAAYEAAWERGLEATGGNYADREFIETATGLGMFRGLRLVGATKYVAQRSVTAAGKFLDKMPVDAQEFSPSAFGVGNIRLGEKAAEKTARGVNLAEAKQGVESAAPRSAEELATWVDEGGNLRAGDSPGMRPDAYRHQSGAPGARSSRGTGYSQAPYLEFTDASGAKVGAKFDGLSGTELIDRKLNPFFSPKAVDQALRQAEVSRHYGLTAVWEMPTQEAVDAANRFMKSNSIEGIIVRLARR